MVKENKCTEFVESFVVECHSVFVSAGAIELLYAMFCRFVSLKLSDEGMNK